jgi:hypothetical protein
MIELSTTTFSHYVSNSSLIGEPGACGVGSKNVGFFNGRTQAYKGPALQVGVAGGRLMFNSPTDGYVSLGDATTAGVGNAVGLIAKAMAIIGGGPVYIDGVTRSISASTALQILLYRAGSYSGSNTGPYAGGLIPPSAPILATTPNASTIMAGTYSTVHWFVRSTTGGRSRKSSPSAVVVSSGFKLRHTVDSADLTVASTYGYDRLGIGVTAAGFGATGPYYEEREIALSSLTTVDTVANSVELQWADGSLAGANLAPIDDYPPPAGVFATAIEDVIAVIGCYGDSTSGVSTTSPGTAIAVSLPVFIESFPPDSLLFLPAPPKGVLSRAADGFVFVAGEGYVAALLYTGGRNPLSLRVLWPTTGIASPNGWFLGEGGRLYAATGKRGLVRIGEDGQPETAWAKDISDDTSTWTMANVVGGFDADHQRDVFGHGQTLYCFNPQTEKWDAPYDLSTKITGNLVSCVTVRGGLLLSASDGTTVRLYNFNGSTGMTYEIYGEIHSSPDMSSQLLPVEIGLRSDTTNTVTFKVFRNGDWTTAKATKSLTPAIGLNNLLLQPVNVRNARSHRVYISQTAGTGDAGPDRVTVWGETSRVI